MGFEPMNTGFADQRVNHFAIGAHRCQPIFRLETYSSQLLIEASATSTSLLPARR
jgi:hypothetical protein